ncbi:MAG: hypothetical protein NTW49_02620 [Bacteroidia bacterium]|nr:hypothetical protein [Bacteroidia bacterium]
MIRIFRHILFFALVGVRGIIAYGQEDNSFFTDSVFKSSRPAGDLNFHFNNLNFFKNNEYFNNLEEGMTRPGYYVLPVFQYQLSGKTRITAGGIFLKYSGKKVFDVVEPVFSVNQMITEKFRIIFGSLEGNLNHQLPEPVFRFENIFDENIENGLQFLYSGKKLRSDIWLNWENFIETNDTDQERFTVGISNKYRFNETGLVRFSLPATILFKHRGGQINTGAYLQTLVNSYTGIEAEIVPEKNCLCLSSLALSCYVFGFKDLSFHYEICFLSFHKGCFLRFPVDHRILVCLPLLFPARRTAFSVHIDDQSLHRRSKETADFKTAIQPQPW